MKNCAESEIARSFEEKREQFTPYGFTCEVWTPKTMDRFDRHNEVEINFIPGGTLTYIIHNRTVCIPGGRVAMFWGLYPHRIIGAEYVDRYYVVTVPLSNFLRWQVSSPFIDKIMRGEVVVDSRPSELDHLLFRRWHKDLAENTDLEDIVMAEVHARVRRLEKSGANPDSMPVSAYEGRIYRNIERMAMFISANYDRRLTVYEVARSANLHPDYANQIFRHAFCHPISEHIAFERIAKAQQRLLCSSDRISTIAYDVGYDSINSFNRAFKKITGLTPRAYRSDMKHTR